MSIIIFIVILLVLVLVHEAGHFFTAKKFGIRVDEFGFGFPPKLFGIKKGETEYTFNLLPLGGFVKIFGESPDEESLNGPDALRSFINKEKWKQAVVLFAGVFMNFALAWLLFSFGFMTDFPVSTQSANSRDELQNVNLIITSVAKNSPAEKAGIKIGDAIKYIEVGENSTVFVNPGAVKSFVVNSKGQDVKIGYLRKVRDMNEDPVGTIEVKPSLNTDNTYSIGISMDEIGTAKFSFFKAFWKGLLFTLSVTKDTILGLFGLLAQAVQGEGDLNAVAGPVGMVGIVGDAYEFGFVYLLSFAALISINLAIINLFPFPALDGGRLFFLFIEKIKGSRINPKFANTANMIGFVILISLMLVITYHDVVKLF
ncbi:RIP metalloprotease RseP [Candidatus Nomurabacteria bacterium]|nr:RIP metalloprotease RseP [Candidatus Nomurabacteria bacterium]